MPESPVTSIEKLTDRQEEVYQFIKRRIFQGSSPSLREIAREFSYRTSGGAKVHVDALAKKGLITVKPHVARGIQLVEKPVLVDAVLPVKNDEIESMDLSAIFGPGSYLTPITDDSEAWKGVSMGDWEVCDSGGHRAAILRIFPK